MKIISWNCNMAFRQKVEIISKLKPDLLIVPECEHPDKINFTGFHPSPVNTLWFGHNQNKGLGVFSYGDFVLKLLDMHEANYKMVVPIEVVSPSFEFVLYAVWANNPNDRDGRYVTQVWKAIRHYETMLASRPSILIGDFNSNTIWDRPRREGNHSTVVKYLEDKGIYSAYHKFFNQEQGKEQHPTLYMYRHKEKAYHIDYCFASVGILRHLQSVEIGDFAFWCKYSDHVPVIVSFDTSIL